MEGIGHVFGGAFLLIVLMTIAGGPVFFALCGYFAMRAAVHPLVSELARVNRNLTRMADQMPVYQPDPPEDEVELEEVHTEEGDRV